MSFERIKFCSRTTFQHISWPKKLFLSRTDSDPHRLELRLRESSGESRACFEICDRFNQTLFERGVVPHDQACYLVEMVMISDENLKRFPHIEVVMLYIALHEIKENGGQFLYILYPDIQFVQSYLQYGFFPAPIAANYRNSRLGGSISYDYTSGMIDRNEFGQRFAEPRISDKSLFRGTVEISLGLLEEFISESVRSRRGGTVRSGY